MTADDRPDPVRINPSLGEGAVSVSEATPMEQAWQALAVEAGPAKSLARLETASARVVTTIATVAAPLTGLGLVAAGQPATAGWPRVLAVGSVVLAFAAVLFALAGQVLTVNPDLNLNNLADVEAWYRDLFTRRAPPHPHRDHPDRRCHRRCRRRRDPHPGHHRPPRHPHPGRDPHRRAPRPDSHRRHGRHTGCRITK